MSRCARAMVLALALVATLPALALAHPLGNFTINHFAALRIGEDRIDVDVVIDHAEIPAFQARQQLDTDADGTVSNAEQAAARPTVCTDLVAGLALAVDGSPLPLNAVAAGLSFPPGAGGLATMRVVCEYEVLLPAEVGANFAVTFADETFVERIGWREIVVAGNGTTISGAAVDASLGGIADRLTKYPGDLLAQPLDTRAIAVSVTRGGPALAPWSAPDAQPLAAGAPAAPIDVPQPAVPSGIGAELSALIDAPDLSPAVLLVSMLIAIGLGAAHAASPGHGKTIMAAYLVGTRGTARHAIGLGMTVTVAHTLGVMLLAGLTLVAATTLPPETLYPILGVASGVLVVIIGASLLVGRLRSLVSARRHAADHRLGHDHAHDREHDHEHHGHSHAPPDGAGLSWRGLFALGLSGGLMPSASALILLLGSISAGRVGYGVLLVVGFGIGMAIVLGGVGLALVYASRLVERLPRARVFGRAGGVLQAATAALVVVIGVVLTGQALTQVL